MNRESTAQYFLKLARHVATRATCPKRAVGCVITNRHGHIKATGYNGVPRKYNHCYKEFCGGSPCMATHAEQNALLQCDDVMSIDTIYCTTSPCITCAKLIANTSCIKLIYSEPYKNDAGLKLLEKLGIQIHHERITD